MGDPGGAPQRQRIAVTHPRTRAATGGRHPGVAGGGQAGTAPADADVRTLMRTQRRLGLVVCVTVCAGLGSLPVLFAYAPSLHRTRLLGVPLPWLVLGVPVYALLTAAGVWYVRRAERNEADFVDQVRRR